MVESCDPYSGTAHQVTVTASSPVCAYTPPPLDGSRSARKGAMRGAPESSRETLREVLALSASSKVMLPSELTKASSCVFA